MKLVERLPVIGCLKCCNLGFDWMLFQGSLANCCVTLHTRKDHRWICVFSEIKFCYTLLVGGTEITGYKSNKNYAKFSYSYIPLKSAALQGH